MSLVPILVAAALLLLALAFGFHCVLLACDKPKPLEPARDSDSATQRAAQH